MLTIVPLSSAATEEDAIDIKEVSNNQFILADSNADKTSKGMNIILGKKGLKGCQVQTPPQVIKFGWEIIKSHRDYVETVVDFGAGDGRFAIGGNYDSYLGIEIDKNKYTVINLPNNAQVINGCVLDVEKQFDICIGNPPYVRHHEINAKWKKKASKIVESESGYKINGLCNYFVYFLWLSLLRTKPDGLVAVIVPFEWVSRPSVNTLRNYITDNEWDVTVYRFQNEDSIFPNVLTTASLTIIDKSKKNGQWLYYDVSDDFKYHSRKGKTGTGNLVLPYVRGKAVRARRGFSPGSQNVFTITEEKRVLHKIRKNQVVPCLTSLKPLPGDVQVLNTESFRKYYVDAGKKCWLLKTNTVTVKNLLTYFDNAPIKEKNRWTCQERDVWYQYNIPSTPKILYSVGFVKYGPKIVNNQIGAIPVGTVSGIIGDDEVPRSHELTNFLRKFDFESQVVSYANVLKKVQVNQMNWVINQFYKE